MGATPPGGQVDVENYTENYLPSRDAERRGRGGSLPSPPVALYDGGLSGQDRIATEERDTQTGAWKTWGSVCFPDLLGPGFDNL